MSVAVANGTLSMGARGSAVAMDLTLVPAGGTLVFSTIDPSVLRQGGGDGDGPAATALTSLTILDGDGNEIRGENLDPPVLLEFTVANASEVPHSIRLRRSPCQSSGKQHVTNHTIRTLQVVECSWVDASGTWSSSGVTTEVLEVEGGAVVQCLSTHLTLFGIVPKMNLANAEDLQVSDRTTRTDAENMLS